MISVAPRRGNLYKLNFVIKNEDHIRTFAKKEYLNQGRNLKRDDVTKEHLKDAVAQTNVEDVLSHHIQNFETHRILKSDRLDNLKQRNVRLSESKGCTKSEGEGSNCKFKRRY